MYIISPLTPLFFCRSNDTTGSSSRYMQVFAPSDQILVEVITSGEVVDISGKIVSVITGNETPVDWKVWSMNSVDKLYYHTITGLDDGCYRFVLNGTQSEPFRVTSDEHELSDTRLIQYSCRDNKSTKDTVFWISEVQRFFDFRVHGGFKDDGWSFYVDNEQFIDSDNSLSEVYSYPSTRKTFTVGGACGCPIWFGELLNRILSCTYVYIDGKRYVRSEANVPEFTKVVEGVRSYIFSQILQQVDVIDGIETDNQLLIRRVESETLRSVASRLRIL